MKNDLEPINIFDFDGTLTTETWPKCWVWAKKFGFNGEKRNDNLEKAIAEYRATHSGDLFDTFFGFFNDLLVQNNETLTYEELMEGEKYIKYNPGVSDFLKKSFAKNYIVSGGLKEFLQGLKIAPSFDGIYGTLVIYNQKDLISGIDEVMKTEKKIDAIKHILKINNRKDNDCRNVYYIGDGYSDAIAMKFVHNNGGKAIFVYQPNQDDGLYHQNNKVYEALNADGKIDFGCIADYRKGRKLFELLQRRRIMEFVEFGEIWDGSLFQIPPKSIEMKV